MTKCDDVHFLKVFARVISLEGGKITAEIRTGTHRGKNVSFLTEEVEGYRKETDRLYTLTPIALSDGEIEAVEVKRPSCSEVLSFKATMAVAQARMEEASSRKKRSKKPKKVSRVNRRPRGRRKGVRVSS